ncbi:MAG: hypothetical protein P4L50_15645 [Anaerolineaceae bacterium]|nr:hypothetical protein [Anaerolineaceae bacterium]
MKVKLEGWILLFIGIITSLEAGFCAFQAFFQIRNGNLHLGAGLILLFFLFFTAWFTIKTFSSIEWRERFQGWISKPKVRWALILLSFFVLAMGLLALKLSREPSSSLTVQSTFNQLEPLILYLTLVSGQLTLFYTIILRRKLWVAIFIWPFIFLMPVVAPVINGQYIRIGNDFYHLYYQYKVYLLSGLVHGKIPLWAPFEAAGFPFYSNPFAQSFYPLNILLAFYGLVTKSYTILDHQDFTVLAVAIFGLGLYVWLNEFRLSKRSILFSTLVMSVSFKVVELLRFPNALHSIAWYPWILYSITKITKAKSTRDWLLNAGLLIFAGICLATGGYPYDLYYAIFLIPPYLLVLIIPRLRSNLLGLVEVRWNQVIAALAASVGIILAVCLPYLFEMSLLLKQTTDRAGGSFAYSISYPFGIVDSLGSLVYPPAASPEGWYFFSILALLLILLLLFSKPIAIPEGEESAPSSVLIQINWFEKIFFIAWIALISYITYQQNSALFIFLWNYLPGFSSLRGWGRMNIILVPILALLVAIAYVNFENWLTAKNHSRSEKGRMIATLIVCYLAIVIVQAHFWLSNFNNSYWGTFVNFYSIFPALNHSYIAKILFILLGAVSFGLLMVCLLLAQKGLFQKKYAPQFLCVVLSLFAVLELGNTGPFTWTTTPVFSTPTPRQPALQNLSVYNLQSLSLTRTTKKAVPPLTPNFSTAIIPNWYFNRYVSFLNFAKSDLSARDQLLGMSASQRLFFSKSIQYDALRPFIQDANRFSGKIQVTYYDGDTLTARVSNPQNGFLSFIDNWDPDWRVLVDNRPQKLDQLFSTFKSVYLSQGSHTVEFKYSPQSTLQNDWDKVFTSQR